MHSYKVYTSDNKVHNLQAEKHHTHPDYAGSIEKWWKANATGLAISGAVAYITHNEKVIWKK